MEALIKTQVVKVSKYAEMTGLSESMVRRMCEHGLLPAEKSMEGKKGGHWYIRVTAPDTVSRAEYDKVCLENREMKTKLKTILAMVTGIE